MEERLFKQANVNALVDFFAGQAYMALGAVNHPQTNAPMIDLPYAKHAIDLLAVIEEKTQGNLTAPETNYLQNVLYQLRMTYVRLEQSPPKAEPPEAMIEDSDANDEAEASSDE